MFKVYNVIANDPGNEGEVTFNVQEAAVIDFILRGVVQLKDFPLPLSGPSCKVDGAPNVVEYCLYLLWLLMVWIPLAANQNNRCNSHSLYYDV